MVGAFFKVGRSSPNAIEKFSHRHKSMVSSWLTGEAKRSLSATVPDCRGWPFCG
jgi:hypothetical protein